MKKSILINFCAVLAIAGMGLSAQAQDTPCTATALALDVASTFDNSAATPDGPLASCFGDSSLDIDIWATFTAPASGWVTAETIYTGSLIDSQLAIYSSSDGTCSGTFTEVACNDDDHPNNPGTNPAQWMSWATACLNPGEQYWVQIDSWLGEVGTFDVRINEDTQCEACDDSDCDAGLLGDTTPVELCPLETTTITTSGTVTPADPNCAGEYTLRFIGGAGATGGNASMNFFLPEALWTPASYEIDATLGGLLPQPGFDVIGGEWCVIPAMRTVNGICSETTDNQDTLKVTFNAQGQGSCGVCDPTGCDAGNLVTSSAISLCPGESVELDISGAAVAPDTVCTPSYRLRFTPQANALGGLVDSLCNSVVFTLTIDVDSLPYSLDSDINGTLSALLVEPLYGTWRIRGEATANGAVCDTTFRDRPVTFLDYGEEGCPAFECDPGENLVNLSFAFDDFSSETGFEIVDAGGTVVESGGFGLAGLCTYERDICLPDGCYDLKIYDAFGDGICCGQFGDGSYTLTDDQGGVLVSGGEFLSLDSTNFCVGGGPDCSAFATAPTDLTKSFQAVNGNQDRVQVKWYKASPTVKYTDEDAAMCDIKFWKKKALDPVTGAPIGTAIQNPDTVSLVNKKKTYGNGDPRSIFKWPVLFRADGANNANRADPNFRYEWKVRCECGHDGNGPESPWSLTKIFNVPDFDPATGIYTPPGGIPYTDEGEDLEAELKASSIDNAKVASQGLLNDNRGLERGLPYASLKRGKLGEVTKKTPRIKAGTKAISNSGITLYPNPTEGTLNVEFTGVKGESASIYVIDMTGRRVAVDAMSTSEGDNLMRLDLSNLRSGLYILELEINGTRTREPFVVK